MCGILYFEARSCLSKCCFEMFNGSRSIKNAVFVDYVLLKLKARLTFETSGINYPVTERHSPEDLNPQLHRS